MVLRPRLAVDRDRASLDQALGGGAGRHRAARGKKGVEPQAGVLRRRDQLF
jgi:hypothetical protein